MKVPVFEIPDLFGLIKASEQADAGRDHPQKIGCEIHFQSRRILDCELFHRGLPVSIVFLTLFFLLYRG